MNVVEFNSLIPSAVAIQPHLVWMLATVPALIEDEAKRQQVTDVLEDLNLKFATLNGEIIELETNVQTFETGDVLFVGQGELIKAPDDKPTVIIPRDLSVGSLTDTEAALRTALAEVIVSRGELEIQQEESAELTDDICDEHECDRCQWGLD